MWNEGILLMTTAASVGVLHTLLGPDHYLPFIFMARSLRWSRTRTLLVTLACGLGHVLASVILGLIGLGFGLAVSRLELIESARCQVAAWLLVAFGLAYAAWGLRRAHRHRPHAHLHAHPDGLVHVHEHVHEAGHVHVHAATPASGQIKRLTPWILFTIFVFGPCEVLVPLFMYPAARNNTGTAIGVTVVFALATLATMCAAVLVGQMGLERLRLARLERYTHALAGTAVACCGFAIQLLGL